MKYAPAFIVGAVLALVLEFPLAAAVFFFLTLVALVNLMPDNSNCNRNCREGRECNCAPKRPVR